MEKPKRGRGAVLNLAPSVIRGTPIYANIGGERIALVPEVELYQRQGGEGISAAVTTEAKPKAIYLIDRKGVSRIPVDTSTPRYLVFICLSLLVGPAIYFLTRTRKQNG